MSGNCRSSSTPRIQVFRPTMEEFQDFSGYITKIESMGAHKAGLAKIIPPEGWCPRKKGYDNINMVIPSPISQMVTGRHGLYQQYNIQKKQMTVKEFKKLAESTKYRTPPHFDYEDLERKYWKNVTYNSPIYGADVSGSLYDDGIEEFNIQHLNTILDMVKEDYEIQIEGVNTAYLYFGMWKTTFAWHTEDMDLYSINYLHFGAPKSWYVIPPEHGRRLERLASNFFHGSSSSCPAFLRHKMTVISPQILKQYSIPYNKITQEPGEFMITFPFGYHSGFNHGYNCAESTNFALPRWVEYGKRAISCTCRNDCVKICMDMFIRKFQPDRYELWKMGKDFGTHPEDPSRHYPAPAPKKLELAIAAQREEQKKSRAGSSGQKIKRHPISKMGKISEDDKMESLNKEAEDNDTKETEIYDVNEGVENDTNNDKTSSDTECEELSSEDDDVKIEGAKDQENLCVDSDATNKAKSSVKKKRPPEKSLKSAKKKRKIELQEVDELMVKNENPPSKAPPLISEIDGLTPEASASHMSGDDCIIENEVEVTTEKCDNHRPKLHSYDSSPEKSDTNWNPVMPTLSPMSTKSTNILNNEFLTKFPNLRQAISNGTLAVIQIPSPKHESSSMLPSSLSSSTASDGAVASTSRDVVSIQDQGSATKISNSAASSCSWYEQGLWKCEHTQGLKVKFVQPKQIVSPIKSMEVEKMSSSCSTAPSLQPVSAPTSFQLNSTVNGSSNQLMPTTVTASATLASPEVSVPQTKATSLRSSTKGKEKKKHRRDSRRSIKAASSSLGNWAEPILDLWQHQPFDFEAEKRFNTHVSATDPHCSICAVFNPSTINENYPLPATNVPMNSKVRMPSFCFGNHLDIKYAFDANPLYTREGTSPLLVCSRCNVCVHATCYGITMVQMGSWTCTRCASADASEAQCCLCVLRGGALKPTTDGRWAHVICTILIPDASFVNVILKEPIDVSKLTASRQRLKCKYCLKSLQNVGKNPGACIQCHSGKCYLPFHVTCGHAAGVFFEANDWPEPINITCTKHSAGRRKSLKRTFTTVKVGDRVLAKHKNRRYYWVEVSHIYTQDYYSILFEDNSTSTNTLPEDVVWREATEYGCPNVDERIRVKWTDGKIYNAIFKNSRPHQIYVVKFDDDTMLTLERFQVYAADEALPREVSSKISVSTERRHIFKPETSGKRLRVSNAKYQAET